MGDGRGSDVISAVLLADLADLGALLVLSPQETAQLTDLVRVFYRDASLAVRSLVGLSLMLTVHGREAVLTALQPEAEPTDITSTLHIPLTGAHVSSAVTCDVVLYGREPDAFAELAAGLVAGRGPGRVMLDRHLHLAAVSTDLRAVRDATCADVAEGVLVGRGFTEVGAAAFLAMLTQSGGGDAGAAARALLDKL